MMNYIIAISGKSGSGKDTAANIIEKSVNIIRLAFARSLKSIVSDLSKLFLGLQIDNNRLDNLEYKEQVHPEYTLYGSDPFTIRRVLQVVADDILKPALGKDIFIRSVVNTIQEKISLSNGNIFLITDLRYLNEYTSLLEIENAKVCHIRIIRDNIDTDRHLHGSEQNHQLFDPDYYIDNNGTLEELANQIEEILDVILRE